MIKPGKELSDMTAEVRAKHLMVREHVVAPEPKWVNALFIAIFYMGFGAAIFYILWQGF